MGMTDAERNILSHTIIFGGRSAVGKQVVAEATSDLLGGRTLVTGRLVRAGADVATRWGLVACDGEEYPRLRRGAVGTLVSLLRPDRLSLHFVSVPGDRALHIFHSRDDLTENIHPRQRKLHGLSNLEPVAAVIATHPSIRRSLTRSWRRAILDTKNNVTTVVAKRPGELVPESPLVVWLDADEERSARFRMQTGANVHDTVAEELAYLRQRDGNHNHHGLDDIPDGAFRIDMNPYLLEPDGPKHVADLVFAEYRKRLGW